MVDLREDSIHMEDKSRRDKISQMSKEELIQFIAGSEERIKSIKEKITYILERIDIIKQKEALVKKHTKQLGEVLGMEEYDNLLDKLIKAKGTPQEKEIEKKIIKKMKALAQKIEKSKEWKSLFEEALSERPQDKVEKEKKKKEKMRRLKRRFRNWIIVLSTLGVIGYGASKNERVQEAWSTLNEEGIEALVEQYKNKMDQGNVSKKTFVVGKDQLKEEAKNTTETAGDFLPDETAETFNDDFTIKVLSDTIQDTEDLNRFYTPCVINLKKESRFDYRNRGDREDIKNTDGAMISTFKPFVKASEYQNVLSSDKDNSTVIAFNPSTGKVSMGLFKEFKDKDKYVVSETWPVKEVSKINVSPSNGYMAGIYQKGLALYDTTGAYIDFPIGIGKRASGDELGGYSGGKILISSPDKKHSWFVYGTANQLSEQLEEFKKTYNVDHVLRYDLDQKAYAQTYQTRDKTITAKKLRILDNFNSAASGAGNILYLKTQK